MQDCYTVEYEMTDPLASQVTRALLADRRHFRQLAQASGFPLLILMVLLFWPTILVLRDQLSPAAIIVVAAILALGFWLMLRALVYRYAKWATLMPFFGQPERSVRLVFSDDRITFGVGDAVMDHKWKEIEAIEVFADLWVFRMQAGGHFVLPAAKIEPGLAELIRRKAGEAGVAIVE
jgi:hypothetical protein